MSSDPAERAVATVAPDLGVDAALSADGPLLVEAGVVAEALGVEPSEGLTVAGFGWPVGSTEFGGAARFGLAVIVGANSGHNCRWLTPRTGADGRQGW